MFAMPTEKGPTAEGESNKSKKELLIDELEKVLELKRQAKQRKKELQAFDLGKLMENDPEMTPERWKQMKQLFRRDMRGENVEYPEHTARERQVNEIWHNYLDTLWVINDLIEKEQELREKIEIEKMRETPAPADLPIATKEITDEFEVKAGQVERVLPKDDKTAEIARIVKEKADKIQPMINDLTDFTVDAVMQYLEVPDFFAEKLLESLEKDHQILGAPDEHGVRYKVKQAQAAAGQQEKQNEIPRNATEITLARIRDYKELAAATKQEGDEKFLQKTRQLWKEIVVHGIAGKDKQGKPILMNFSDLDGNCAVGLLGLAGINTKRIEYVEKEKFVVGKINLDTGNRHGVVVEDEGRTAFFDHHAAESGSDTCATKIVYDALVKLGLLEKQEWLDKLVEFVNHEDNQTYPSQNPIEDYKNSWQSLLGLSTFIKFEKLADFFQNVNKAPHEPLTAAELKQLGLAKKANERKKDVEYNARIIEGEKGKEAEVNDFVVETAKYGKIIIDIVKPDGQKLLRRRGFPVAKAFGYGGHILWNPSENSFFLSTVGKLEHSFSQGRPVRETMWIKPEHDSVPLAVTLEQVLTILADGNLHVSNKLERYFQTGKLE
ncbi:hypothetical protein HY932_00235 [Candidatus Falkowbacteria bacterium]|nr:hypothetical protein [Candidatus Falkowbacteria bacterium]